MARVVLVTGASSGNGLATGLALPGGGQVVYPAARRVDGMAGIAAAGGRTMPKDAARRGVGGSAGA